MTGQEEIEEAQIILTEKLKRIQNEKLSKLLEICNNKMSEAGDMIIKIEEEYINRESFIICPLFANLPPDEQMKAFT